MYRKIIVILFIALFVFSLPEVTLASEFSEFDNVWKHYMLKSSFNPHGHVSVPPGCGINIVPLGKNYYYINRGPFKTDLGEGCVIKISEKNQVILFSKDYGSMVKGSIFSMNLEGSYQQAFTKGLKNITAHYGNPTEEGVIWYKGQQYPYAKFLEEGKYEYFWGLATDYDERDITKILDRPFSVTPISSDAKARLIFIAHVLNSNSSVVKRNPERSFALVKDSREALLQNDLQKALLLQNEAISFDSENKAAYMARGNTFLRMERYTEAIQEETKALSLDSHYAPAYIYRATAFLKIGDNQNAKKDFSSFVKYAEPDDPNIPFAKRKMAELE